MVISVDIADRLYDFTDEERAAEVIAEFQDEMKLNDEAVVALWASDNDPRRVDLEQRIFAAVDTNGSVKRARESIPSCISLTVATD